MHGCISVNCLIFSIDLGWYFSNSMDQLTGLCPALPFLSLWITLRGFLCLAVVIQLWVSSSTCISLIWIVCFFKNMLVSNWEKGFSVLLQVRLWDVNSGTLLDTCEVGSKVSHFFLNCYRGSWWNHWLLCSFSNTMLIKWIWKLGQFSIFCLC